MPLVAAGAVALSLLALPQTSSPAPGAGRVLLVPLDSRPASGQFAQMMGRIADVDVRMPPYETLGRFTTPGDPDAILGWLERQPLDGVVAVVASADMLAYGGLIESRVNSVPVATALTRLKRFSALKKAHPNLRLYAFSSTMRLAPTATRQAAPWRMYLAKWAELEDKANRLGDVPSRVAANKQRAQIPTGEIERYRATRRRNHDVQRELVRMAANRELDFLTVGQDDAREYGPHVGENRQLQALASGSGAGNRTYFCEGIDQLSNVLLSRALLTGQGWTPKVRVVYSDPARAEEIAPYESKTIRLSLRDHVQAAGAEVATSDNFDYTLYVNTPKPDPARFAEFAQGMADELDNGLPVAVADINLASDGTSDPRVFAALTQRDRANRLLSFAGWNTAGNTIGTAIPAANLYLLARKTNADAARRELAQREFLLHRFVDDVAYHKYVRPEAYKLLKELPGASKEETTGTSLATLNAFVQRGLSRYAGQYFRDYFFGRTFYAGPQAYQIQALDDVKVWLPWPRAYEVRIEFRMDGRPVAE